MIIAHVHTLWILAEGDGVETFFQIIVFAVIIGGSLLSAYLKKSNEKREQEKAQQRTREIKDSLARGGTQEQATSEEGWQVIASPPPPVEAKKPSLRDFMQRRAQPSMFASPPKPVAPPEPRRVEPAEPHLVELRPIENISTPKTLHPELPSCQHEKPSIGDLIRKRKAQKQGGVMRELSEETLIPAIEQDTPQTRVALTDSKTARAAIIFHEIFSRPKALHDEPELWD